MYEIKMQRIRKSLLNMSFERSISIACAANNIRQEIELNEKIDRIKQGLYTELYPACNLCKRKKDYDELPDGCSGGSASFRAEAKYYNHGPSPCESCRNNPDKLFMDKHREKYEVALELEKERINIYYDDLVKRESEEESKKNKKLVTRIKNLFK